MKTILFIMTCCCLVVPLSAQTLDLQTCKQLAHENNSAIKTKMLDKQLALETQKEAFTRYFPTLNLDAGYMHAGKGLIEMEMLNPETGAPLPLSFIEKGKTVSLTALQPIFAGGQIVNGNRLAKLGQEVSRLQYKLAENDVERMTEHYFWQVVQLTEKLKTIDCMDSLVAGIRNDVEWALKAGVTTRNDLLKIELQESELESQRLKVENGIRITKLLLGQYIGISGTDIHLTYALNADEHSPMDEYVNAEEVVHARPEAGLLTYNVKSKELQKRMEIGKYLPSVGVGGTVFYHDFMGKDYNTAALVATVSIPISDWWSGSHAIKKQTIIQKQAELEKQNAIELLVVQIEQTWNELQEAYKQIRLSEKAIVSAAENLRMNSNMYRSGMITINDLLEAQSLLQKCDDQMIEAQTAYQLKLTDYRIATGR